MPYSAAQKFRILIADTALIKHKALNRDDPRFSPWYDKVREAVFQIVPVKRSAFEEITFASDFFLSKAIAERESINDRIALVSDLKLAVELLEEIVVIAEKEKVGSSLGTLRCSFSGLQKTAAEVNEFSEFGWGELFQKIESSSFSNREKEEVFETLESLRNLSKSSGRDWDRFKRGIKFLLDFDRELALEVVPFLIETFKLLNE